MTTTTHGRIASAAIIGISNTAIAEALQAIDKAKTMPKGFLTTITGEVKKLNGMLMDAGDIKIVAKKLCDIFASKYETPLALRNAHLGHDPQLKRFADKAKAFGIELDFGDVGRMLEIAREGFGADVVALDTRRDNKPPAGTTEPQFGSGEREGHHGFRPKIGGGHSDGRRIAG